MDSMLVLWLALTLSQSPRFDSQVRLSVQNLHVLPVLGVLRFYPTAPKHVLGDVT